MTSAFSWQNSVSLCPASFCIPRPNLPVTPGVSGLPTFAFQSPIMKRTSFLGVSSKRSCRSSQNHSTSVSSALLVGAQTWITVILNGLPQGQWSGSLAHNSHNRHPRASPENSHHACGGGACRTTCQQDYNGEDFSNVYSKEKIS